MALSVRRSAMLVVLLFIVVSTQSPAAQQPRPHKTLQMLEAHRSEVVDVNTRFEEVFGPVPALASTPFLGLAILTGAALLADLPVFAGSNRPIVQRLRRNVLILEAKAYASWWLFSALVLFALTTALANSGKLQGVLGKMARATENLSVGVAYLAVAVPVLAARGVSVPSAGAVPTAVLATVVPVLEFGAVTMIVTAAIAIAAMMVVRFAFDLLIWLNPVPLIDLFFEGGKTMFSIVFLAVYFVNPIVAAILSALVLIPCLLLLPWAVRLQGFAYRIVFCPLLAYISPVFNATLTDPALPGAVRGGEPTVSCRANVLKARGLRKRQAIALVQVAGRTTIQPVRRKKPVRDLAGPGEQVVIGRALAWIEVRVLSKEGEMVDRIALPHSMSGDYDTLCALLAARNAGEFGALKVLRDAGRAARHSADAASRAVQDRLTLD